jgi:hypothetical protein
MLILFSVYIQSKLQLVDSSRYEMNTYFEILHGSMAARYY